MYAFRLEMSRARMMVDCLSFRFARISWQVCTDQIFDFVPSLSQLGSAMLWMSCAGRRRVVVVEIADLDPPNFPFFLISTDSNAEWATIAEPSGLPLPRLTCSSRLASIAA